MRAPIAIALDAPDLVTLRSWARLTGPHVAIMKVGLEAYLRDGPSAVHAAREESGASIFLDLKLHDIPNTVAGACRSVAALAPDFLTVHASGGAEMVRAAAHALPGTSITAVTILTSLSADDLSSLGLHGSATDNAVRLAAMAVGAGARAVVCSPHEVGAIRGEVGDDIELITPGVRPIGADTGDQSRTATPEQALADGADFVVIGRPVTAALDPAGALRDIVAQINASR
jgi:orotidine-5'-phosphate decarboxylase